MKNSIVESKNDQLEENKANYHHRVNLHGGPTWGSYMGVLHGGPTWGSYMGVLHGDTVCSLEAENKLVVTKSVS